jgi:hypothetical protein
MTSELSNIDLYAIAFCSTAFSTVPKPPKNITKFAPCLFVNLFLASYMWSRLELHGYDDSVRAAGILL